MKLTFASCSVAAFKKRHTRNLNMGCRKMSATAQTELSRKNLHGPYFASRGVTHYGDLQTDCERIIWPR